MEQRGNKTIVCSVFFLDIVEYSKKSVSGQISLKERFNAFLSTAIRNVPLGDRIILDTGDGAAISFLGDIEDALQAALSMRSSLLDEGVRMEPALLVRMGINLGPVRLVKDINGQPNIVGDGINVSQRVMGFADPGQILVSRSYFDAVSRLSQDYAGMFHYQGSRTDKHVREHEVYAIGYPGDFTSTQRSVSNKQQLENANGMELVFATARNYWLEFAHHASVLERRTLEVFRRASTPVRVVILGFVGVVMVSMVLGIYKLTQRPETPLNDKLSASSGYGAHGGAFAPGSAPVAYPVSAPAVATAPGTSAHAAKVHVKEKAAAKEEGEKQEQGVKKSSRVRTLAETTGGPALVSLSIQPWGEVYLDGKLQGVSPPLLELQVVEGKHIMEIKNSTFPVFNQTIIAKPATQIKIRHSFK
jgi:hypothetical protein